MITSTTQHPTQLKEIKGAREGEGEREKGERARGRRRRFSKWVSGETGGSSLRPKSPAKAPTHPLPRYHPPPRDTYRHSAGTHTSRPRLHHTPPLHFPWPRHPPPPPLQLNMFRTSYRKEPTDIFFSISLSSISVKHGMIHCKYVQFVVVFHV